jgi:glutamate synthase domain-containing protein 1
LKGNELDEGPPGRLHSSCSGKTWKALSDCLRAAERPPASTMPSIPVAGRPVAAARDMMLIPEPWWRILNGSGSSRLLSVSAAMMEPRDGPAAVCFTDENDRCNVRP